MTNHEQSNHSASDTGRASGPSQWNRRRAIYLLPNLLTTAALFSGFFAIVSAVEGQYEKAAIAIFVAMVLDGLDGRVARMTNTQSDFGAEYDSMADMVSFGMAPAILAFSWALQDLGKVGWIASFIFVAGAALRLARFNTQLAVADKHFFTGLASPSAAALVAGTIWSLTEAQIEPAATAWLVCIVVALSGLLMVSNVRYQSFKGLEVRDKIPFVALLAIVLVFVVIAIDPARVLLGAFALYAVSGPLFEIWRRFKKRKSASNGVG